MLRNVICHFTWNAKLFHIDKAFPQMEKQKFKLFSCKKCLSHNSDVLNYRGINWGKLFKLWKNQRRGKNILFWKLPQWTLLEQFEGSVCVPSLWVVAIQDITEMWELISLNAEAYSKLTPVSYSDIDINLARMRQQGSNMSFELSCIFVLKSNPNF